MKYRVVTVAREYGAGGSEVARIVAGALGWRLLDHALLTEIGRTAHVPMSEVEVFDEMVDPWICRLTRPLWGINPDGFSAVLPVHLFDADQEAALADRIIRDAHDLGGCVIVGRAAQCVLKNAPDVFHVFVYASWEERIERIRSRHDPSADLENVLTTMDERRLEYVERHYKLDRLDPHLYDMLINCNNQPQLAAEVILTAMQADKWRRHSPADMPAVGDLITAS